MTRPAHRPLLQRGRQAEQRQQHRSFERSTHRGGGKGGHDHYKIDVENPLTPKRRQGPDSGRHTTGQIDQHETDRPPKAGAQKGIDSRKRHPGKRDAGQCCHKAVGRKVDLHVVFLAVPRRR